MKSFLAALVFASLCGSAWAQGNPNNGRTELNLPDPPMLGQHYAHGGNPAGNPFAAPKSPNLTYHNGGVMNSGAVIKAIFWGSWNNAAGADKISGLDSFYGGVGGSSYLNSNTEYTDSTGHVVTTGVTYQGHVTDASAAPTRQPSTGAILDEVCKMVASPVPNGYYPVYVDAGRRNANYCAWHSWGTCGGTPIQFAFFFNLDGDAGCDPEDSISGHSQGLAAVANVSGHELSEALTDPRGAGWFDQNGAENSDKCAWTFDPVAPVVTFSNLSKWKIQGNWSNAAYTQNTTAGAPAYPSSYANGSGQKGCISIR